MPDAMKRTSDSKRTLIEQYVLGDVPQITANTVDIPFRAPGSPIPLSFGQQQVWLLCKLIPNIPIYNECVAIHLPGPLDVTALEQSLNEFIRRHESWRTSFPLVDGVPVQLIHPPATLTLAVVDLRYLPVAERESEALRRATEDACILFDLEQGPLLRTLLIRLSDEEHRLFLTLHHIIFDSISIYQVLLLELYDIYEAFLNGRPLPSSDIPIQCADYTYVQRERLQGDLLAEQLRYWKKQLADAPATLQLPTDRPRQPVRSYRGSTYLFALSKRLTDDLKALSHREETTLFMILVAAFNSLLHRYTGQEDLVIGTSASGRTRSMVRQLMGCFLNTLVLRSNLSGNPTFRELLSRIREVINSAVIHEDLPFEYLVKELRPERNLSQNPLFQVLLTLEPAQPTLPGGWTLTRMDISCGTSKFDLTLELEDRPDSLFGRFEYNTDLFDTTTIYRMSGHLQTLLEGIVADPTQHLSELPILTEVERHQLLVEWNSTQAFYPKQSCIHQLFEDQVKRTPDKVALVYQGTQLTFRQLNARANQLAHFLRQLGVRPEVLVGLCIERSLEMMVGLLGILKAGGAYVPLDPTYPAERVAFMVEDSKAPVLVTQQRLVTHIPTHMATVVCLDSDAPELAKQSKADPATIATAENVSYVIYTSGSTGRPKGVQVLHRAVINFLTSMRQQPGLTAEDTLLAVSTLSFDIAALELILPLTVGARVVVASSEIVANGTALVETLARSDATVMQATPISWRILLAAGWQGNRHLKILCGGEALPLELARQLLSNCDSLWNLYGPTETTIYSTGTKIELSDELISIGHPIANTQIYVLDSQLQPVPIGVAGELYIGGDGLARGYLNRPELTAEKFIPDPFSNKPDARIYRTGDLARYRSNGTIELIGRLDHQVKIRGFRIELGEIEAVLGQHPEVRQGVVVARGNMPGDKRLVAYVIPRDEQTFSVRELQSYLMKKLPTYMIPSAFVTLEVLPQTPNGKVDRHALPAPEPTANTVKENSVAPTLLIHHQLLAIWEEMLDIRPIGIRDSFFDLGGNSFLAVYMVNRFEQVSGKKIPLTTLFAGPTIEQLSHALMGEEDIRPRAPTVAVQAGGSKRPLFFLHGDWTGGAFYCLNLAHYLGPDQPFYVLEPYRFDDLPVPPTFEAMAAAHIKSLRELQHEGPYLLAGWCNGALVAYEMARQLQAEEQKVDLLVLMDPETPGHLRSVRRIISSFGDLIRLDQAEQFDSFLRLRHLYRWLRYSSYRQSQDPSPAVTDEHVERKQRRGSVYATLTRPGTIIPILEVLRQDWLGAYDWIVSVYTPHSYTGKVTLFWASEEAGRRAAWSKMPQPGEVEVHVVPGTHDTCRTDYLRDLAEHLRTCLEES
jgi:amino acid adenylation domain-containing protein